ncbi:MAG: hypothetical protein LBU92_05595 [Prevotellaceae bacterium]|jgi:tetratricopeptide (TPR) repeat protein|nr:hypothetical protein [Prevotellaceae bacterium]
MFAFTATYRRFFALLLCFAIFCCTQKTFAQAGGVRAPIDNVNKAIKGVSDSVAGGVEQVNKELKRGTEAINKGTEKLIDKTLGKAGKVVGKQVGNVQDGVEGAKEKVNTGVERLKAATIKKNTWVMRTYHNVTAYYNVYFNAQDAYKEGVKLAEAKYPFDYTRTLPIFTFGAEEITSLVSAEMTRTLDKSNKAIKEHSLTTKPELKKGKRLTKKEQDFYNKREYCNSIDDAYLLIGKANLYMHEYELAERAFDLVMVDYNTEITSYEARIWNAILAGEQGNVQRQREILSALESDKKFPKEHKNLLNNAYADLLIREKKYGEAIPKVEQAAKKSWRRVNTQRFHFILGQLYQEVGNPQKAVQHYTSVVRRLPPYDLEFHAKLNKAYLLTGSEGESMRKALLKMARDEKNGDYLDKIYFALAGIEMRAGRTEQGVEYYKLSAANSKSESPQRVISCLTLAKYFEGKGDYEPAQAYYDSTAMVMPKTDPEYEMVNNKAQNLGKLAVNLRIIKTEDSLQRIARMSTSEREKYAEKQVEFAKAAEEKRQRAEEIRLAREAAAAEAASAFAPPTGKWYFYNPQVVGKGLADFKRIWGNRPLTDDWRRGSKAVLNDFPEMEDEQKTEEETVPEDQTTEYYLANVPLTDSLMEASNTRLMEAIFDAGMVYKDYILDKPNAIKMLEMLLERFPGNRHTLEAYFYLYVLNSEEGNTAQAERYKNLLVKEFPDELLTKYVLDPTHVSDNEVKEKAANQLYAEAFVQYQKGSYQQAIALSESGLQKYDSMSITANFKLLNVMAKGSDGNIGQYITGLNEVVKNHVGSESAQAAQAMLSIVQPRELALVSEQKATPAAAAEQPTVNYSTDDGKSVLALIVPKGANLNQLKFNFLSFNADMDADDLVVQNRSFGNDWEIVTVHDFKTQAEAFGYYKSVKRFPPILKDTKIEEYSMFSITQHNLELLEQSKIISLYLTFFQSNIEK